MFPFTTRELLGADDELPFRAPPRIAPMPSSEVRRSLPPVVHTPYEHPHVAKALDTGCDRAIGAALADVREGKIAIPRAEAPPAWQEPVLVAVVDANGVQVPPHVAPSKVYAGGGWQEPEAVATMAEPPAPWPFTDDDAPDFAAGTSFETIPVLAPDSDPHGARIGDR